MLLPSFYDISKTKVHNLLIVVVMILKGLALYALMRELLPKQPAIAFGATMLYTVYFADLGVFWPVAVNVHAATLWALLAAWLLLRQWRKPAILNLVFMAIFQIFALSYEGVFAVIFVTPFLLLFPARGLNQRVLKLGLIWYAAPTVMAARYIIVSSQMSGASYQSGQANIALQGDVFSALAASTLRIYKRLLGVVWYDQKSIRLDYRPYWLLAAGMGALAAYGIYYHLRASSERLSWRLGLGIGTVGFLIIGLGFAPYLVSEYRDIDYRVYFTSMAGSSLLMITVQQTGTVENSKWAFALRLRPKMVLVIQNSRSGMKKQKVYP